MKHVPSPSPRDSGGVGTIRFESLYNCFTDLVFCFPQVGTAARTKIYKTLLAEHRHLTDAHKLAQADLKLAKGTASFSNPNTNFLSDILAIVGDIRTPS